MIRMTVAAGLITAGLAGAGAAQAAPGVAYDNGNGHPIHIGDTSASGATAQASPGNKALAISISKPAVAIATDRNLAPFVKSTAIAVGVTKTASAVTDGDHRSGNTVVAVNGTAGFVSNRLGEWDALYYPDTVGDANNLVVAVNGTALVHGKNNRAISVNSDLKALPVVDYGDGTYKYAASAPPLPRTRWGPWINTTAVGCNITPNRGTLYRQPC